MVNHSAKTIHHYPTHSVYSMSQRQSHLLARSLNTCLPSLTFGKLSMQVLDFHCKIYNHGQSVLLSLLKFLLNFLSPQVNWSVFISDNSRFRILKDFFSQNINFMNTCKELPQNSKWTFPVAHYSTWSFKLDSNILPIIIDNVAMSCFQMFLWLYLSFRRNIGKCVWDVLREMFCLGM